MHPRDRMSAGKLHFHRNLRLCMICICVWVWSEIKWYNPNMASNIWVGINFLGKLLSKRMEVLGYQITILTLVLSIIYFGMIWYVVFLFDIKLISFLYSIFLPRCALVNIKIKVSPLNIVVIHQWSFHLSGQLWEV